MADNTLQKEWLSLLEKSDNIYIYGAGKIGKQILSLIASSGGIEKVRGFLTTLPPSNDDERMVNGIAVSGIENFTDTGAVIFVAVTDAWQEEIRAVLKKHGFDNYVIVYKYSFLLGDTEIPQKIPSVASIDIRELLLQQYRNGKYNRLDVIVRVLAVEQYYGKNDFGMDLYAKMQVCRNPTANGGKYHELALSRFKELIQSVEKNGYDLSSEIIVDKNLQLVDGAHRLSLIIYHHIKNVKIRILDESKDEILYGRPWFEIFFSESELAFVEEKFHSLSSLWRAPICGIIWPPAVPFADEIVAAIRQDYAVTNLHTYDLPDAVFEQFVKGVYHVDSIADWKVEYKINEFAAFSEKKFMLIDIDMPYPDFRIKETGTSISRMGEALKKKIRESFKGRIENYHPDVIFHTADNFHQSEYMRAIIGRDFSLRSFFESIANCRWMLVKLKSDYLPEKFPDSIPLYKDIDMIVSEKDFDRVVCAAEDFLKEVSKQFSDKNLRVRRVEKVHDGCVHIRQEQEGFLIFQIDCSCKTDNINSQFIEDALGRRCKKGCYCIPEKVDECVFRMADYLIHPQKKKHKAFIDCFMKEHSECKEEFAKRMEIGVLREKYYGKK